MKLVRDHIPALIQTGGLEPEVPDPVFRRAAPGELGLLLRLKLVEEVGEILSAATREKRIAELYDLRDVIQAYLLHEKAWDVHERMHADKLERRGGFAWGWVLED